MEAVATAKNIRISPTKVRLVVDQIKKMKPQDAIAVLGHVNKAAAMPVKKVVASAIANAKHNQKLDEKSLIFKSIEVNQGRTLKRWQPISRGRAHSILKRTSHIRVVLETKEKESKEANVSQVSKVSQAQEVRKVRDVSEVREGDKKSAEDKSDSMKTAVARKGEQK